jgi:hypothetical protein
MFTVFYAGTDRQLPVCSPAVYATRAEAEAVRDEYVAHDHATHGGGDATVYEIRVVEEPA